MLFDLYGFLLAVLAAFLEFPRSARALSLTIKIILPLEIIHLNLSGRRLLHAFVQGANEVPEQWAVGVEGRL